MTQIRLAVGDYSGDIQKRLDYTSDSNVYEYSRTLLYLNSPKHLISQIFVK